MQVPMEVKPDSNPNLLQDVVLASSPRSRLCRVRKTCVCCSCLFLCGSVLSIIAMVWGLAPTLQCTAARFDSPLADACEAANALQSQWYNKLVGGWGDTEFWGSACAVQAFVDFMQISGTRDFASAIAHVHELRPAEIILMRAAGSYDDALWWAGAYLSANEVMGDKSYLESAKKIFDSTYAGAWDTGTCRGGMWWSSAKTYKNAITNSLALWVSANLFLRTGTSKYLDIAQGVWRWFGQSGMLNRYYLANDGLTADCENNMQTTWTYNQGVLIGGLVALSNATRNLTMLEDACRIADSTLGTLVTDEGILQEEYLGNRDNVMFKGIFAKHLSALANAEIVSEKRHQYRKFLSINIASLLTHDKSSKGFFGGFWQGPVDDTCDDVTLALSIDDGEWSRKLASSKDDNIWPSLAALGFHAACVGASAQVSALHLLNAGSVVVKPKRMLHTRFYYAVTRIYKWFLG